MTDDRGPAYWGRHDYAPCTRCGVLRPLSEMAWLPTFGHYCTDVAWCRRQSAYTPTEAARESLLAFFDAIGSDATGLDSNGNALPPVPDGPDTPTR